MNLIQYINTNNSEDNIVSNKNGILKNGKNIYKEYNKLNKLNDNRVTDENKHQYLSCLTSKGGKTLATVGMAGGIGKEVIDFTKKCLNPKSREQYDSIKGIYNDGVKDIRNNAKGMSYGLFGKSKCINLLERKIP